MIFNMFWASQRRPKNPKKITMWSSIFLHGCWSWRYKDAVPTVVLEAVEACDFLPNPFSLDPLNTLLTVPPLLMLQSTEWNHRVSYILTSSIRLPSETTKTEYTRLTIVWNKWELSKFEKKTKVWYQYRHHKTITFRPSVSLGRTKL